MAALETTSENWSNRLRISELFVEKSYRRKGLGHHLLAIAKEQTRREKRRALILETQSSNVPAITFYLKEGFTLIGFDSCAYSNEDLQRKEVRLELGWFPEKRKKVISSFSAHENKKAPKTNTTILGQPRFLINLIILCNPEFDCSERLPHPCTIDPSYSAFYWHF